MTKKTLDAIITTYGDRITQIKIDNGGTVFLNYKDSPKISDIRTDVIGTDEFFIVRRLNSRTNLFYEVFHKISTIIHIDIAKNDYNYIDPWMMK